MRLRPWTALNWLRRFTDEHPCGHARPRSATLWSLELERNVRSRRHPGRGAHAKRLAPPSRSKERVCAPVDLPASITRARPARE